MYTKEIIEKKRKRIRNILIAIIVVILFLMAEVTYLFFSQKDNNKEETNKTNETITNVIKVENVPTYEVSKLDSRISALEFAASVGSGIELLDNKYTARIDNDKVILSINGKEKEYVIDSPISVVLGAYKDKYVVIYVLSKKNKLYEIRYDLEKNKDDSYVYSMDNIVSIDIDTGEVNVGDKKDFEPAIYFKTSDNKLYTSDKLVEGQKNFVELLGK